MSAALRRLALSRAKDSGTAGLVVVKEAVFLVTDDSQRKYLSLLLNYSVANQKLGSGHALFRRPYIYRLNPSSQILLTINPGVRQCQPAAWTAI